MEERNRFKGLDLIDRVPDELWNEVRDIVQETGIRTIPMEKKCKNTKWLSGEALQIAVKRRDIKSKGERQRYKHLNAEFQRIARRDKKAFFSDQCKKAKWLSGEALQRAVKRRVVKSKREKERYKHLNAEYQRIARRDKKAFFSDLYKEIEEKNRMGKT